MGTDASARKAYYEFFQRVFQHEPDAEFVGGLQQIGKLGDEDFDAYTASIAGADATLLAKAISTDYVRLFLGMSAHPVSPFESVYRGTLPILMQEPRDEAVKAYRAEGFAVSEGFGLPEDHIAVELAYMAALCGKEVAAREGGDAEEASRLVRAQAEFLEGHLAKWVVPFAQEVSARDTRAESGGGFYAACARMLVSFIESERLGAEA